MRKLYPFISLLIIAVLSSHATYAIVEGDPAASRDFDSVFFLEGETHDSQNSYSTFCSATLIHPQILLTAAHCFEHGADFLRASQGKNSSLSKISRRIIDGAPHPKWATIQNKISRAAFDIGYIVLEKPILDSEVKPAEIVLYQQADFTNYFLHQAHLVGYGISTDLIPQENERADFMIGTKRTSIQTLSQVTPWFFVTSGLRGALAPGDSGGGMFFEVDGKLKLMGVNSEILILDNNSDRQSLFSAIRTDTLCWIAKRTQTSFTGVDCSAQLP